MSQLGKKLTIFFLCAVILLAATASASDAAVSPSASPTKGLTSSQPLAAAKKHPIQYHIACPPSMINDGSLDYFKAHGFSTVELIAPDQQTYKAELNKIKSLGMRPIIDIETPIWSGSKLASTPITSYSAYFQSLKAAGWQYVASEGGRDGDCSHLSQFFKGYINYNCDQCGLWKDVYKDPFTVMNSWECYYPQEWQYIQQGAKEAASLGKQNGLLAGVWEYGSNGVSANPILTNSKNGGSPSYKTMLDWSYANGIGFNHFGVWCAYAQGLTKYKQLGFEQVIAQLQQSYPATNAAETQPTPSATPTPTPTPTDFASTSKSPTSTPQLPTTTASQKSKATSSATVPKAATAIAQKPKVPKPSSKVTPAITQKSQGNNASKKAKTSGQLLRYQRSLQKRPSPATSKR